MKNGEKEIKVLDNGIDIGKPDGYNIVGDRYNQLNDFIEVVNKVNEEFHLEATCYIPFINTGNKRRHPVIRNIHFFRDEHGLETYDDFDLSYLLRVHGYDF